MMSLWDALRMNMMISYQELVRTFPKTHNRETFMIIAMYWLFAFYAVWTLTRKHGVSPLRGMNGTKRTKSN
ncbi:hypothetical protein CsakCS09_01170 [Cronobacter sakazakii]|nr:hypothetical protein CsakCS09_01170 [Cronobacter sakazakii]